MNLFDFDFEMTQIAWKIRAEKETTLWQLQNNNILVDIIKLSDTELLVRLYYKGRYDVDYADEPSIDSQEAFKHLSYINKKYR